MWKKNEPETFEPPAPSHPLNRPQETNHEPAIIGPSIYIKGDLTGGEDLIIQGRVEGKIDLKKGNVTVGRTGRVKADIYGKIICVEGQVQGNLHGAEKVVLSETGTVGGSITAPRVNLVDGARFQGTIDMGDGKIQEAQKVPPDRRGEETTAHVKIGPPSGKEKIDSRKGQS